MMPLQTATSAIVENENVTWQFAPYTPAPRPTYMQSQHTCSHSCLMMLQGMTIAGNPVHAETS